MMSGKGFALKSATRFNLSEPEVLQSFVEPWQLGVAIVAGGKVFDPRDSEIQIREGPTASEDQARSLTAWIFALENCNDVTDRFITEPPGSKATSTVDDSANPADRRRVAVVHGRDTAAAEALFGFLRDIDLHPLEWSELVKATGSAAPNNRSVVERLFTLAAAAVVLLTPDEEVRLHPELISQPDHRGDGAWACQARPNVYLEAGMALAVHPSRTVLVEIGVTRAASDLHGVNAVRLDGTAGPLHDLANRLGTAGCAVSLDGTSWLRTDRFAGLAARVRLPSPSGN
jgi:predicted nucleotide-binding protein